MAPDGTVNQERFLSTLQKLLAIPAADLRTALSHAADALADALRADKVDAFLYDESRDSLVALGASLQPLSNLQRRLGLDVLPTSNGGRTVDVYQTGRTFVTGNLQEDPGELRGVKEGLRIQSELGVPLEVAGRRRGMIMVASLQPDFFIEPDVAFTSAAAHWVGMVAERSELIESIERNALEEGRRTRAEEVITVLAHDLRNYISPVMFRLYGIRSRAQAEDRRTDLADVHHALDGLAQINSLIADLLDTARLDSGAFQINLQPVDIVALVHAAAATLSQADHAIVVKAAAMVIAAADPNRMRQCIDNVLSNAVSHSPAHAPVTVFISEWQHEGKRWGHIEVVDEGPGVPDAMLPHVFDRFFTGPSRQEGIGLGLYIAKRIAMAHGGDVLVDRYPGKGARFTIRIPMLDGERVLP